MGFEKCKPAVHRHWLLLISGIMWTAVGIMLCAFAFTWLRAVGGSLAWVLALVGVFAGVLVYRLGFLNLAVKNIGRIGDMAERVCVFAFQAPKSYLVIIFMIALGIFLRHSPLPKQYLAIIYLGIGVGLFLSSVRYYRHLYGLVFVKNEEENAS